jgi:hypothetical protein
MAANPKRYPRKLNSEDGSLNSIYLTALTAIRSVSPEQEQACIRDSAFLAERGLLTRMDSPRIASRAVPLPPAFNQAGEAA